MMQSSNTLYLVSLILLCCHLACTMPPCDDVSVLQFTVSSNIRFQCNCEYAPTSADVTWCRDGEEVSGSEVEGATIEGNTVTFHGEEPSMEANWTCKTNENTSPPRTLFVPPKATDTEVMLVKGQVSTFPSGIQVGPRTRELCGYEIAVDQDLSCNKGNSKTLLLYQHTPGDTVKQVPGSVNSSLLKLDTGSFNLTYKPNTEEEADMVCLHPSVTVTSTFNSACPYHTETSTATIRLASAPPLLTISKNLRKFLIDFLNVNV